MGVNAATKGESSGGNRRALGSAAEGVAAAYLRRRGCSILEANVRCRLGEIDLVALEAKTVLFVEVKSNRGRGYGAPEEMVTAAKQRRLTRLALWYLQRRGWLARPARFDVAAVDWTDSGEARIRYFADAFTAAGDI